MSGRLDSVLLGNEVSDPLLRQPSEPQRHGVGATPSAAIERELEDATLDIELWQFANERDIPTNWTWHKQPSPERLETTEQLGSGARCLNKGNTVTKSANHVFDKRLVCDATVPVADNENFIPPEAA